MGKQKKTIVLDARMLDKSGIGTYLKNVVQPITEEYDFIFLGDEQEIHHNFKNAKIIPYNHPIYSIKEQLFIPVKVPRCDLFWSPHINIPLLPVLTKKRLVTIHDMFHAAQMNTMSRMKKAYTRLILNSLNIYKPDVITVSEFSKSEILKYTKIPNQKITVAYNGYDNQKFKLNGTATPSEQKPYILYVGNVKPHKNLGLLVDALHILKNESRLHVKLMIVGKKDGFIMGDDSIAEQIDDYKLNDDVQFTGRIDDTQLVNTYQHASLLVFPSKYEGFGLPPLEAMACGCPSIVSDISVFRELYQQSVIYTPLGDAQSLASNITKALENTSLLDGLKNAFPETLQKYTWKKSQEIHLEILEKIFHKTMI